MFQINEENLKNLSADGARGAFGKAILEVGEQIENSVVVSADLLTTLRCVEFAERYPDRTYDVGIAEQNLIAFSTGMALGGHVVFTAGMASFTPMRCAEQFRSLAGYMKQPVKMVAAYSGVMSGTLGNTHSAIEDIAVTRVMPNVSVVCPCDGLEIMKATMAAAKYPGPMYIRLTGDKPMNVIYHEDFDFEIGKAITLTGGNDVAIIATGTLVYEALEAAKELKTKGINTRVIDMHTVKPLDEETVKKAFTECGLVVTLEEHCIIGGLGSAVSECMAATKNKSPHIILGIPCQFDKVGVYRYQLQRFGLTAPQVAARIIEELK